MMNPLRLSTGSISIVPAPVLRSVALATGIVGLLAASGSDGLQSTGAAPPADISAPSASITQDLASAPQIQPSSFSIDDLGQTHLQTQPTSQVAVAEPLRPGDVADVPIALHLPEAVVETAPALVPQTPSAEHAPQAEQAQPAERMPPTEDAPAQIASVNPADIDLSDIQPNDAIKAPKPIDLPGDCLVVDGCVDRYLWTLYQRTPKEDTLKTVEWRDVTVERKIKVKGKTKTKTVTVSQAFTKLVDQDFGWKDPKAAERAGMPMMDYVIGGMDRNFKLKLFRMLRAAEAAGLSPGITSAFRDDYRQSIASGLKAASNRSYHGGSLRGGYGHGVAADVVSVDGATRNQRFASSTRLWTWVDAHGKEFGIARPYLGRDPPHVAPVDGEEYAKHNRGTKLAAADAKKADAKKADAKKSSVKLAGSNAKDVSLKEAQADVKNAKDVNAKAAPKTADLKKLDLKKANTKQIDVKKPNLVIMRDSSNLAKRVATRDVPPLSKRAATRHSSRLSKSAAIRDAGRPAKREVIRDNSPPAKRPKTAVASKLKAS